MHTYSKWYHFIVYCSFVCSFRSVKPNFQLYEPKEGLLASCTECFSVLTMDDVLCVLFGPTMHSNVKIALKQKQCSKCVYSVSTSNCILATRCSIALKFALVQCQRNVKRCLVSLQLRICFKIWVEPGFIISVGHYTSIESKIHTSHGTWLQKHKRPGMKIGTCIILDTLAHRNFEKGFLK